jgi:cysteine desulfurase/selenocysteine lyase
MEPAAGDAETKGGSASELDVAAVRAVFPALARAPDGPPLVYLDNAATTQKPRAVLDALERFYVESCATVHRGVHRLSQRATAAFEEARAHVKLFLGARGADEIVFVRGTTEALNLVAWSWARPRLVPGDEIVVSELEHHSNIVPWQLVCAATGARLVVAPADDDGALAPSAFERVLGKRTKIVAVTHASNALGTLVPVAAIAERAHAVGAVVVVDGAQGAPHVPVDVRALGADFYAFSGHKVYGPTGIGVLYGRREHFAEMPPWQGGGEMIRSVTFEHTTYQDPPRRFEAGTPDVAGAVGLAAALGWLSSFPAAARESHARDLLRVATAELSSVPDLRIVGRAPASVPVVSFAVAGADPHALGALLDREGIAVRTGHHCAEPILARLGLSATVRASFGIYNTVDEARQLAEAVRRAAALLRG